LPRADAAKASLILGAGALLVTLLLVLTAAALAYFNIDSGYAILGGLWVLCIGAHIVGAGFGIEGLIRTPRKRHALAGLLLNATLILLWTILIPVALSQS